MMGPQIVDVTYANVTNNIISTPRLSAQSAAPAAAAAQPAAAAAQPAAAAAQPAAPAAEAKPKLYVATPCYGCLMSNVFLVSLLQLQSECAQRGIECFVDFVGNESLVQRARNILTARFLKSNATHLLFIDADIGFRPDTVFRLLDSQKDIVTAVYPKKAFDWEAVALKLKDPSTKEAPHMMGLDFNINLTNNSAKVDKGFVSVLDSATGFMMITRGVLERMAARYESTLRCVNDLPGNRDDPGYPKEYVALFDCMIDKDTRRYLSEDYAFVRRAQEMGVEIWADIASPLCHVGNYSFEGDLRQRFAMVYAA